MTWALFLLAASAGTLGAFVGMRLSRLLRRRREAGVDLRRPDISPEGKP